LMFQKEYAIIFIDIAIHVLFVETSVQGILWKTTQRKNLNIADNPKKQYTFTVIITPLLKVILSKYF
ncbi:MAG TPA: hypothetical protein VGK47_08955, partial [Nitrososphaeraceae archaeon]